MELENNQKIQLFNEIEQIANKAFSALPHLDTETNYWLVRADAGEYYTDFNINRYVGIGWNEISLEMIDNCQGNQELMKNELKSNLNIERYPKEEITERKLGSIASQLLRFYNNIQINDFVLVPSEGSKTFLVGRVRGEAYEASDEFLTEEVNRNYKKSKFKKRYPVSWIGRFNRDEADSALYKMIYSHTTLTNINDYKPYINRALFPAYIESDNIHLTFKVSEIDNVESMYLGQFLYDYAQLNLTIDEENLPDTRINVQSPGFIEMISTNPQATITGLVFLILFGGITFVGGEFSAFGITYKSEGLLKKIKENNKLDSDTELKKLEVYERAVEVAQRLGVPISELNIDIPDNLSQILDQQFDDQKESKDSESYQDPESKE